MRHHGFSCSSLCTVTPEQAQENLLIKGFKMIRMNLFGGYRLCSVGMLWTGRLILRPFGTSLMPLGPFVLQPYFDAFGQRLLWSSAFAIAQGLTTQPALLR